jgi:uncharacterized membrane protein
MTQLIIGLVVFLGIHSISIVAPGWRDRTMARIGGGAWKGLYSLLAIVGLVLIVHGYGIARQTPIIVWVPPRWLRDTVVMLMVFVFPLLFAAYLPGRIRDIARHPMLLAVKIWALLHLLANGAVADMLLFGSILLWAGADRASLKRRPPRPAPALPASRWNDWIAVIAGFGVYAVLVNGGHLWLIGVPIGFG